jgi:hypothetical protein
MSQPPALDTLTPVEIDTALYEAYAKAADITAKQQRTQQLIAIIDDTEPGSYASLLPERSPERRAKLVAEVEAHEAARARVFDEEINPREAEHDRRGWTRYYLVDNTNGHVHKDQDCPTCFPTTRYDWLVEQSGMTPEKLVELAGEKACTVCFPWAPVDVLKRKTQLESVDKKAARLEREAKKAAAAAKKAAKAIADEDGSPLKVFTRHYPERQVVRGGKVVKTHPAHDGYDTLATLHAARGWLADQFEAWRGNSGTHRDLDRVADAVARKEGKTRDQVIEEVKQRAARRR